MVSDILIATEDAVLRRALEAALRANGRFDRVGSIDRPTDLVRRAVQLGTVTLLGEDLAGQTDLGFLPRGRVILVAGNRSDPPAEGFPVLRVFANGMPDVARIRADLIPAIDALPGRSFATRTPIERADRPLRQPTGPSRPDLLVFGASTGSPTPLIDVLTRLGPPSVPVLVAIHMPADQTAAFAAHLEQSTKVATVEVDEGPLPAVGSIAILRGGANYDVCRGPDGWMLRRSASRGGPYRPSIDLLLASAAASGLRCDAVILSGMGSDGAAGAVDVEKAGGRVFVQLPETCVVPGMPMATLTACRRARAASPAMLASCLVKAGTAALSTVAS